MERATNVLRYDEVCRRTKLSRTTIWRRVNDGTFPKPFPLIDGGRVVGWDERDIEAWFQSRKDRVQ